MNGDLSGTVGIYMKFGLGLDAERECQPVQDKFPPLLSSELEGFVDAHTHPLSGELLHIEGELYNNISDTRAASGELLPWRIMSGISIPRPSLAFVFRTNIPGVTR